MTTPQPPDIHAGHPRRWAILGVLILSLLVVILDNTILNVALKTIQEDLDATQSQMEWAINSYTLVFAGLMFTAGVLGDRFGRKRLLMVGMLAFGAASALAALADSPAQLIATRALMGIGAAMVMPQTLSIITNIFTGAERGKAIGIWAGFSGIAVALGPITGGFLLEHYWWGSVFLINVPVVILGVTLATFIVPDSKDPKPQRLDPLGVLISIAGIVAVVYGIIKGGETSEWGSVNVLGPIVAGTALLALFVWMEKRSSHPALDISLFKKPQFSAGTVSLAIVFFAMMGLTFAGSYYLQSVREFEPLKAGLLIVPVSVGMMITAALSSKTVAAIGTKATVSLGMTLSGAAMGGHVFLEENTSLWIFGGILFLMGVGMGNAMAPATEAVMSAVPREKAGAGSAVNNTVRMAGGALGVAILGSIMSTQYRSKMEDDVTILPDAAQHDAGESIGGTFQAVADLAASVKAGEISPAALAGVEDLIISSKDAFVSGMHSVAIVSMLVAWAGAVIAAIWLPGKEKPQDRTVTQKASTTESEKALETAQ